MRFGLVQSNMDKLEDFLMTVSHPDSPEYGQHWSMSKVAETFAPSRDTIGAVTDWLVDEGIALSRLRLSPNRAWIEVNVTGAEAEELLDAEYHVFTHSSGKEHVACHSYSVPQHVRHHVDIITPTVHFDSRMMQPGRLKRNAVPIQGAVKGVGNPSSGNGPKTDGSVIDIFKQLADCDQLITPDCLRALYEVVYIPVATHKNTFGIVEYTPQAFLQADLDMFFTNFSKAQVGRSPTPIVLADGAILQTIVENFDFNGESDLDLQYGMALTFPQDVTLYQVGDIVEGASFNNFLDAIDASYCTFEGGDNPNFDGIYPDTLPGGFNGSESCGIAKPANVISTSYGANEVELTPAYANRQCAEYAKLGLMGVTILYSSGDDGVAGFGGLCLDADGNESTSGTIFNPSFPGGCPFVTSVGATQVNPNSSVFEPEGACEQVIFSGGGFSNIFARPSYQVEAVQSFLTNHPPPFTDGQFNTSFSRGFPDLSANGANYVVAVDGEFIRVFGTSCSSPVVGSILTLINDARLAIGKRPIGFINPTIYSSRFAHLFNDITQGGNQGCGTPGFTATTGWDPVTGLGTPNFPKLLAAWLELP